MSTLGVDVSGYQTLVDWRQLRIDGYEFAYARACDGLNEDRMYRSHTVNGRIADLLVGGYGFCHPTMDVKEFASFFLSLVSMVQMRPVLDMETLSQGRVPSNAAEWCDQAAELVKAAMVSLFPLSANARRGPIVYASTSYWRTMCVLKPSVSGWDWWAAEYRAGVGTAGDPTQPMPDGAVAWQYSGDVPLKGQVGLYDLDVAPDLDRLRM